MVRLPDLGVRLAAKLDTGALSSVLHGEDVEMVARDRVRFRVPLDARDQRWRDCEADLLDWRSVRDSGGHDSMRPVIRSRVVLGGHDWVEELTLYPRRGMRHRLLLGRRALVGRFVVDPEIAFSLGRERQAATVT